MTKDDILAEAMRKLTPAHLRLKQHVPVMVDALYDLGFPIRVFEVMRTAERQQELYARGRTQPGRIVTKADGVVKLSKHQLQSDGLVHATDLVFLNTDGYLSWDLNHPWTLLGVMGEALGFTWGGRFRSFDGPHLEV